MKISTIFMTLLVALAHLVFMVLEIFFWQNRIGRSILSMTAAQAASRPRRLAQWIPPLCDMLAVSGSGANNVLAARP